MTETSVSVIIASRDRPSELTNCLKALTFQTYRNFEVVVVANTASANALDDKIRKQIKFIPFELANISAARNVGICEASGDIIAFIDDDAIAEPTWISALLDPLQNTDVVAVGGFVRGRNGISFQWKAETMNMFGETESLEITEPTTIKGSPTRVAKTQGTNCAFRRAFLVDAGGFDENYHYYLDETDLNIRLGHDGQKTVLTPFAEVQHGFAANAQRASNRAPKSLFEIGASSAYFIKKFELDPKHLDTIRQSQSRRLRTFLTEGLIEPRDVRHLEKTLEEGFEDGSKRMQKATREFSKIGKYRPYLTQKRTQSHRFITGKWFQRKRLHAEAKSLADQGIPVTLLLFSPTTWRHRRYFNPNGYWVQTGGIFGKASRDERPKVLTSYLERFEKEITALQANRP